VDDHEVVRRGVKDLINGDRALGICGEASNGKEAVEKTLELKPDLVLMDLTMPGMNGIQATKEIRRLAPATVVVILSLHDSPSIAAVAKQAGARDYVVKTGSGDDLIRAIRRALRAAHQGTRPVDPGDDPMILKQQA
jgi:DNA-binding NarL/FixJ family response regulator